jgi:hypothetical protein
MKKTIYIAILALITLAAGALLSGCRHNDVTAPNAAPTMAANRAEMIKWHQEHDKKPASSTPSGQ